MDFLEDTVYGMENVDVAITVESLTVRQISQLPF